MALKGQILLFCIVLYADAELLRSPFPGGYAMGTLGAIGRDYNLTENNYDGVRSETAKKVITGCDISWVGYYDAMDNLQDRSLYQVALDGYIVTHKLSLKVSVCYFDALATYYEQNARVTAGYRIAPFFEAAVILSGERKSIRGAENGSHTVAVSGGSVHVYLQKVSAYLQCDNLVVKHSQTAGVDPDCKFTCGFYTRRTRLGAQGFQIEITPESMKPFRWKIGEEVRFLKYLGMQVAIGNNPVQIAMGLIVELKGSSVTASLVNSENLGWSRGVNIGYRRNNP